VVVSGLLALMLLLLGQAAVVMVGDVAAAATAT